MTASDRFVPRRRPCFSAGAAAATAARLTAPRSSVSPVNSGRTRVPTMRCWCSGTGRWVVTTMSVSPRTVRSQPPNSSALLTVAERDTRRTRGSRVRIASSHTGPRERSARKWTSSMTTWVRESSRGEPE